LEKKLMNQSNNFSLGSLSPQTQQEILDLALRNIALTTPTYNIWIDKIYKDLDIAISRMIDNTPTMIVLDETGLTAVLAMQMQAIYQASAETFRNGNADISIEHNSFRWIGEAKIIESSAQSNLKYVDQGFLQLTTRYAKGQANATSGGMLIYIKPNSRCKGKKSVMKDWQSYLTKKYPTSGMSLSNCALNADCFYSEHIHETAEDKYKVRHMPIVLHHKPQDNSGLKAKIYRKK